MKRRTITVTGVWMETARHDVGPLSVRKTRNDAVGGHWYSIILRLPRNLELNAHFGRLSASGVLPWTERTERRI